MKIAQIRQQLALCTCPVMKYIPENPVIIARHPNITQRDQMYERNAITHILQNSRRCPLTRTPLNEREHGGANLKGTQLELLLFMVQAKKTLDFPVYNSPEYKEIKDTIEDYLDEGKVDIKETQESIIKIRNALESPEILQALKEIEEARLITVAPRADFEKALAEHTNANEDARNRAQDLIRALMSGIIPRNLLNGHGDAEEQLDELGDVVKKEALIAANLHLEEKQTALGEAFCKQCPEFKQHLSAAGLQRLMNNGVLDNDDAFHKAAAEIAHSLKANFIAFSKHIEASKHLPDPFVLKTKQLLKELSEVQQVKEAKKLITEMTFQQQKTQKIVDKTFSIRDAILAKAIETAKGTPLSKAGIEALPDYRQSISETQKMLKKLNEISKIIQSAKHQIKPLEEKERQDERSNKIMIQAFTLGFFLNQYEHIVAENNTLSTIAGAKFLTGLDDSTRTQSIQEIEKMLPHLETQWGTLVKCSRRANEALEELEGEFYNIAYQFRESEPGNNRGAQLKNLAKNDLHYLSYLTEASEKCSVHLNHIQKLTFETRNLYVHTKTLFGIIETKYLEESKRLQEKFSILDKVYAISKHEKNPAILKDLSEQSKIHINKLEKENLALYQRLIMPYRTVTERIIEKLSNGHEKRRLRRENHRLFSKIDHSKQQFGKQFDEAKRQIRDINSYAIKYEIAPKLDPILLVFHQALNAFKKAHEKNKKTFRELNFALEISSECDNTKELKEKSSQLHQIENEAFDKVRRAFNTIKEFERFTLQHWGQNQIHLSIVIPDGENLQNAFAEVQRMQNGFNAQFNGFFQVPAPPPPILPPRPPMRRLSEGEEPSEPEGGSEEETERRRGASVPL